MPPQGDYSQGNIHVRKARNGSVEILNPPPDSPMRKTTLFFGTFNLVATIVGGGELSLPLVFAKAGLGLATAMMIFAAIITDFSLYLLCCCARRTGSTTYMDIVRVAFGPLAEICTTILLWMMLSGALIAYYVLLKGIFGPLVKDILSTYTLIDVVSPHFDSYVLLGIIVIIFPLKLQKNLYALRHICYVGFTSVWVVTISIGVRAYQRNKSYSEEGMDTINSQYDFSDYAGDDTHITYITKSWNDALFAFPIVVLAFLCSFNIVEVHGVSLYRLFIIFQLFAAFN
jgi:amino acid permease